MTEEGKLVLRSLDINMKWRRVEHLALEWRYDIKFLLVLSQMGA